MGNKKSTSQKLDKKSIQQYRELTKLSEEEIQEWYQEFCEECPDGKLKYHKFRRIFIKYFHPRHAKNFCNAVFHQYDQDHDGSLNFKEFLVALSPPSQLNFKDHLGLLFDVYDTSDNQRLDSAELKRMIKIMYDLVDPVDPVDGEQIKEIVRDIIPTSSNNIGVKDFDKRTIIDRCYNHPDIRELLAPNMTADNENQKKNASSQTNESESSIDPAAKKKSDKSSSSAQLQSVGNMSTSQKRMPVLNHQRPGNKNQIHTEQEQNTNTFKRYIYLDKN